MLITNIPQILDTDAGQKRQIRGDLRQGFLYGEKVSGCEKEYQELSIKYQESRTKSKESNVMAGRPELGDRRWCHR